LTSDNTTTGDLVEIKRFFIQNDVVHEQPMSKIPGLDKQINSITDDMCGKVKTIFGDKNDHIKKGGLKKMGDSMEEGMVLVMSIWDDHAEHMLWLDSTDPPTKTEPGKGGPRGTCATTSGVPKDVEAAHPHAHVKFSDIKFGDICSTFKCSKPGPPGPTPGDKCPGGSLIACMGLCPSNPAVAYKACVETCVARCPSGEVEDILFM